MENTGLHDWLMKLNREIGEVNTGVQGLHSIFTDIKEKVDTHDRRITLMEHKDSYRSGGWRMIFLASGSVGGLLSVAGFIVKLVWNV